MIESKEKLYVLRQSTLHYIDQFSEDMKVYVYFHKTTKKIIYIDKKINIIIQDTDIYETTLKNLYLYLFFEDYENTNQALLVFLANKELYCYSDIDIMYLLDVTYIHLKRFETGLGEFKGPFSFENLETKLGFKKEEFTLSFNTMFKKVDHEQY